MFCYRGLDVHIGKECMNHIKYQKDIGATAACTKRMMEAKKEIGQKYINGDEGLFPFC